VVSSAQQLANIVPRQETRIAAQVAAIHTLPAINQRIARIDALQTANAAKLLGVGNLQAKSAEL